MRFLPLVWAMLWRSRTRTWLTFLSIMVAFVLFALLRTLESGFFQGIRIAGNDRLITTSRQGFANVLPYAYRTQIESIPGVRSVQAVFPFGAIYQDAKQQIGGVALDFDDRIVPDPRVLVSAEHLAAWRQMRTGVLVGRELLDHYGWKVGDRIPVTMGVHRKDGTQHWELDIVGTWEYDADTIGRHVDAKAIVMRYDYWNEAVAYPDLVLWYAVTIAEAAQADAVVRAIDAHFLNAPIGTKTQLEREFQAGFLRQIGDIGAVLNAILAAVFFTLLLVAGNTLMQGFRERVPELGVLKTLGFTDLQLAALAAGEAVLLCCGAAAAGLALSALALRPLRDMAFQGLQMPGLEAATVNAGLAVALGLSVLAAILPAWKSARLTVVDALAQAH